MEKVANWGNYPVVDAEVRNFGHVEEARKLIDKGAPQIVRGMGRCYGDSALAPQILSSLPHHHILDFDEVEGIVTCESGCTLDELLKVFVPKGWFLPVTPGTKFITIGGAIASDVHGKNHHVEGSFSDHLISFRLMTEDGEIRNVTKEQHDIFYATCGGMGLTGIILDATFKMKAVETSYITQETHKAGNLSEVLDLFQSTDKFTYSVAWIDCLASGKSLGRSLLMLGEHAYEHELPPTLYKKPRTTHPDPKISIPFYFPSFVLNSYSIKAFDFAFYHKQLRKKSAGLVHYDPYFYPLDAVHHWNRAYGRRGFTQYQFAVPYEGGAEMLTKVLQIVAKSGKASFLAVLKTFGKQNGLISFPIEGYTLTMDFAIEPDLFPLLDELDRIVLDYGGRLYLTKDVRMSSEMFFESYPNAAKFAEICRQLNPSGSFRSLQSDRLGITGN